MTGWIIKRGERELTVPDEVTLKKWADEKKYRPSDLVFHPLLQRWLYAREVEEISHAFGEPRSDTVVTSGDSEHTPALTAAHGNQAPVLRGWGLMSRLVAGVGGSVAIFGGVTLLGLKAAGENSLIEALAHGIGIYCIGKGLFMIGAVSNIQAGVDFLAERLKR